MVALFAVLWAVACAYIGNMRGRNPFAWFCIGLFLNMFGVLLLYILPNLKAQAATESGVPAPPPAQEVEDEPEVIDITPREWYYTDSGGAQQGPISLVQLRHYWREGVVKPTTYVWSDGMAEWKKIEACEDLQRELT